MLGEPAGFFAPDVREQRLEVGMLDLLSEDRIQFAVKQTDGESVVYVLEVNPRASRTSPFVSKATNVPLPKIAAKIMAGVSLAEQGVTQEVVPTHTSVKESVFPFNRFVGVDIILGPEMKSTGEAIYFIDDLMDDYFMSIYAERNFYLSR